MTPVQFFDPVRNSWTIFAWGENSQLHKWSVGPTGKLSYVAQEQRIRERETCAEIRRVECPEDFVPARATDQIQTQRSSPAPSPMVTQTPQVVNGRLLVYDPVHLAPDGSLKVLWDSQRLERPVSVQQI